MSGDGSGMSRMAILLSTFADELADELAELDELRVRLYMFQVGQIISWIGHGDNEQLPEGVREFAEMIQPTPEAAVVDAELVDDSDTDTGPGSYPQLDSAAG